MKASDPADNINDLEQKLLKIVLQKQDILLSEILSWAFSNLSFGSDGLNSSSQNYGKISQLNQIYEKYISNHLTDLEDQFVKGLFSVDDYNRRWINQFVSANEIGAIQDRVFRTQAMALGIDGEDLVKGGKIWDQTRSIEPIKRIKAYLLKQVQANADSQTIAKDLNRLITAKGLKDKVGIIQSTNTGIIHDTYSQFDRGVSREVAIAGGLEFFIYQGGTVADSRKFCKKRNGKVFHISEAESWRSKRWEGKIIPVSDPITDLGGYNCIHLARFISTREAERRGKNIAKFIEAA